jgi:hypothetical protein
MFATSRIGRPLHFECVASQLGSVPVTLKGPNINQLATRLLRLTKRHAFAGGVMPRLFGKFTPRGCKRLLSWFDQSFWDASRPMIFPLPEGATRMS